MVSDVKSVTYSLDPDELFPLTSKEISEERRKPATRNETILFRCFHGLKTSPIPKGFSVSSSAAVSLKEANGKHNSPKNH
jgi:hypothetical protein